MTVRDRERGFTLLEIMISLAIIGGLLVTLIYTLNYHLGIAARHETLTVATMLAKNKVLEVEKGRAKSAGDFPEPYTGYSYTTEVSDTAFPGISKITVTVTKGDDHVTFMELTGRVK
jgi:general secretion pathway protein I